MFRTILTLATVIGLGFVVPATRAADPPATPASAPAAPTGPSVTVKLVPDFESGKLVSDLEEIQAINDTEFDVGGAKQVLQGENCTLWVRNAHVDGRFFFERYYQGKYIGRHGRLEINLSELGPGEHVIEPGNHKFSVSADNKLSSVDPDIRIEGLTLSLRLHKITISGVDAAKTGPVDFRLVPADLGLLSMSADLQLDPKNLPDLRTTYDPQHPPAATTVRPPLMNVLSQQSQFYPLTVWLPANQVGQGYLLYPSWQAFHITPEGKVDVTAAEIPKVAGIEATARQIVIPYRRFSGKVNSRTQLTAGVGAVKLNERKMNFGATLAPVKFVASHEKPTDDTFFLPVDNDFSNLPHKFFLADNSSGEKDAIRLMAMEWAPPVFPRASETSVQLRFLETTGKETLKQPQVRMSYSVYDPSAPAARNWFPLEVLGWTNGRESGELRFRVPDVNFCYVTLRVQIFETGDKSYASPLTGDIPGCIVDRDQHGSASFVANRGRNAFVVGEDVELAIVLRSDVKRASGDRTLVVSHPDGHTDTLKFTDPGEAWHTQSVRFPASKTINLSPGAYTLSVRDLPSGIASVPFRFDLVGREKASLYHIVKPSKYTGAMNGLETSHLSDRQAPINLDRAMATIAELGYTRVDLMTYITHHHMRGYTWREELAATDPRLPPAENVFAPSPRDQILNACVRNQLQYSDIWLSYGDFHLPRQIEGYTRASERWMAREMQAMRHSPALDGMMLYDEMYQGAVTGLVEGHAKMFPAIRARLAEKELGATPAKIEQAINRYIERPRTQRDPAVLEQYLRYQDWQQHSWAEYCDRMTKIGKELLPRARFGTYHRTWMSPGANDEIMHGYPPDLFKNMDIISHVHYADNSTCWVNVCMMAQILRTGQNKTLYVNMPIPHEWRTNYDGQYQRHMAFAMLTQGANGVSQWGMNHSFDDGPNTGTAVAKETTARMNFEILRPFGEIVDRTVDSYRKVGIVSTLNQHALSTFKQVPVANQSEGIWTACWRLGYPAVFVREEHMNEKLDGFSVLFVPGVHFDRELDERVVKRLKEAIASGVRVIVEGDSTLDLPGITRLADWVNNTNVVGNYFPTWLDDELNKVYEKSQPIVDYLGPKFKEWGIEPAASGPFKVGPTWRRGGEAQYLLMANFDDPDYTQTVRQQMAKPLSLPLTIAASRGNVAYDLLAQKELPLAPTKDDNDKAETSLTLDMRRIQGAIVAFLPERLGKLQVIHTTSADPSRVRIRASLVGQSGKPIDAVFPTQIKLYDGSNTRAFQRVLGQDLAFELDLPQGVNERKYRLEVRESLSGQTVTWEVAVAPSEKVAIELVDSQQPQVPYPAEIRNFLKNTKSAVIIPSRAIPGAADAAQSLAKRLKERGIEARIADENRAYRLPTGDPKEEDPTNDGFHTWRNPPEIVGPGVAIDEPAIVLGGRGSSFLIDALSVYGYLSSSALGGPGQASRPSLQVAKKGFHYAFDSLCLIANDKAGIERNIEALFGELKDPAALSEAKYGVELKVESKTTSDTVPALAFMGTNEMVNDLKFDAAGNLYAITWGHGKNLYSFGPGGQPRWSRHLPEMGANRLDVFSDRLLSYTASGARMYHLTLDNKPVAQARLNLVPGSTQECDNYSLSTCDYVWLPQQKRLLHNMGESMRILDEDYNVVAQWHGEEYFDRDVADKVLQRKLHGYAISPGGDRIAQLETSSYFTKWAYKDEEVFDTHLVLRDLTGKLLYEFKNVDNGKKVQARLIWPEGSSGPVVYAPNDTLAEGYERWNFGATLELVAKLPYNPGLFEFANEKRLIRNGRQLVYFDGFAHEQCVLGPFVTIPTYASLSPDGHTIAVLDEYRALRLFSTSDGKKLTKIDVPEIGKVLRFTPDSQRLILGGVRGGLFAWNLNGELVWQLRLADSNDILDKPIPLFDSAFKDFTPKLWPTSHDESSELDTLARTTPNRLINADCEATGGWQGQEIKYAKPGYESGQALTVGPQMVGQEITGFLGTHVTWTLEFHYRSALVQGSTELLAGIMTECDQPDSVAARFQADQSWKFGRVVIKNGNRCQKLLVGFSCQQGQVLVDRVRFRQIRFPSVNHLQFDPIYQIKPVILENPLFSEKYDPVGNLREQAPARIMIPTLPGPLNLIESAYLQNGRLNEVTSNWYIQPFNRESVDLPLSLTLKEPRWISMVALYFNQYDAKNVTPHFDIFVNDPETNTDKLVASVRGNGQVFRLIKFPPVKTSLVKVTLIHAIARLRTISEIELYGPLSGREGTPGFVDAEGHNTYMGDFSRVDKRPKQLIEEFRPPFIKRSNTVNDDGGFFAPLAEVLVSENRLYAAHTFGRNTSYDLADPAKELSMTRAGGLGFTPYGALYGGLLIRCGNDGKLYCLNPESGGELWTLSLGERLFGCPVAIGEDIYVAGSDGRIYQIDLASGTIMKDAPISGLVFGSLATDGQRILFITDDGSLNCYSAADLKPQWKTAMAPYTDSTPAIDGGVVYLADQHGTAMAIDAVTGSVRWRSELGDEFTRCPVVGPDRVIFGCRGGTLAILNRADGKVVWTKKVESRFSYEPVMLGDRVLFFRGAAAMLAQLSDGAETPLQINSTARKSPMAKLSGFALGQDPIVPISYYKGSLFFIERAGESGHGQMQINMPWHVQNGSFTILQPVPPAAPVDAMKK